MWRVWLSYFVYHWGGMHRYVGHTNKVRREYERAAHYFSLAYRIDPTFTRARLDWANLLWRELQQYDTAVYTLTQLLKADPSLHTARFNLALLFLERGQYDLALAEFETYLAQATPEDTDWDSAVRQVTLLQELLQR